jgi:hypothetical protein
LFLSECHAIQDEDWTEEEKLHQGFKEDEFAFLSDLIGPTGMAFDNDDVLEDSDDEDLKSDPISQMDMQVRLMMPHSTMTKHFQQSHLMNFLRECAARNTNNFSVVVGQLTAEEMLVVHRIVSG